MINIVLCGGNGTRLWPLSRKYMPKQFVKIFNEQSLFELTLKRNSKVATYFYIVSNETQYFLALDQSREYLNGKKINFLLEPIGRNTAPAIALTCFSLDYDDIVLVTPSDHLIKNEIEYENIIKQAKELAEQNYLITFGISPKYPDTGYGYIQAKKEIDKIYEVKLFHEKPNKDTAIKYLKNGNFFWNSGIFCFKAGLFLEELKKFSPEIYNKSQIAFKNAIIDRNVIRIQEKDMNQIPEDSIDYAVMEKSNKVKLIESNINWNDLGSFDSLSEELPSFIDTIDIDSDNNFIYSDNKDKIVATIGLKNYIIIDTKDAILISKKGKTQEVKKIVKKLNIKNPNILESHKIVYRPWGSYEVLMETKKYKIKKIIVKPGKRLSLQKHFHRSEHWVVVSGTATVIIGNNKYLVSPNESKYIKIGEIHRLENEGKIDVVLIEVQVGEYIEEDDIIRLEDDFKRV